MKQFFGACESYRRSICLLACGELSQEQQAQLRNHLAVCTECQEYYDEISEIAGTLAGWERNFEALEPGQATRERWARDFAEAEPQLSRSAPVPGRSSLYRPAGFKTSADISVRTLLRPGTGALRPNEVSFAGWKQLRLLRYRVLDWCKEVIWPCRRIWTGLAAVWLILLGINLSEQHPAQTDAAKHSQPSLEMVRAYLTHEGFLAKPSGDRQNGTAERPALPVPSPRSEQGQRSSVG
jgi:hypothetical protein